jgi:hypothetical protein
MELYQETKHEGRMSVKSHFQNVLLPIQYFLLGYDQKCSSTCGVVFHLSPNYEPTLIY